MQLDPADPFEAALIEAVRLCRMRRIELADALRGEHENQVDPVP
ncbi:hypothetical protein [Kocuria rosea]|nr:hypothetical protein [Kocuria rosea]WIG18401.1 hypothetical protein QOY29_05585 [Kocuria rosea]